MSVYKNDRLKFVKESVRSILQQTFTDFDYFLIFDGPVSADVEIYISSLGDKRISLFKRDKNEGLAVALNFLFTHIMKNSQYKYIARMDADDISLPSRFEKQRAFLSENTEISIVGSWYEEIDESGKILAYKKLPIDHDSLRKRYMRMTPFAHASVMYRTQLVKKAGFYPTNTILMEDNVLWGRALKEGLKLANIPEFLFQFRIDRNFYKRRSGFEYGWKYLKTRIATNRLLHSTLCSYLFIIGFAVLKMSPFFINKAFYRLLRSHKTNT